MQELRFVAVSEDGRYAVLAVPGRSARFTLPIDERLRAVALGQTSRLAQYEIEVESPLRPKEIQARIRAGETVEEIADAAGIAVERVRWFEGPVLAERAYIADQAQAASVRRPGESTPGPRLGEISAERLSAVGADPDDVQWDARKRGDGNWQVLLTFTSGGRLHVAEWMFDPRRRHVIPVDDNAARMSLPDVELPAPPVPAHGQATVTRLEPRVRHEPPAAPANFGPAHYSGPAHSAPARPETQPAVARPESVPRAEPASARAEAMQQVAVPFTPAPTSSMVPTMAPTTFAAPPTPTVASQAPAPPVVQEPPIAKEPPAEEPAAAVAEKPAETVAEPAASIEEQTAPPAAQPVAPEPVAAKAAVADPVAADPVVAGPVAVEPVAIQPVAIQPVAIQPVAIQPVAIQPEIAEPVPVEPAAPEPVAAKTVVAEPAAAEPVVAEPVAAEPVAAEPVAAKTVAAEPVAAKTVVAEPVPAQPATVTAEPSVVNEPAAVAEPAAVVKPTVVAEPAAAAPEPAAASKPAAVAQPAAATAEPAAEPAAQAEPAAVAAAAEPAVQEVAAREPASGGAQQQDSPPAAPSKAAETTGRPGRKNARGRRSSVPSWDEIMLGSSRQQD